MYTYVRLSRSDLAPTLWEKQARCIPVKARPTQPGMRLAVKRGLVQLPHGTPVVHVCLFVF